MNAKLVKRMRQHARRLMGGAPARGLVAGVQHTKNVRAGTNQNGTPRIQTITVTSLVNDPKTVRGMYRNMKKGWANKEAR
jgi:hypothetical protein